MNLTDLAAKIKKSPISRSILVYGAPKTGKTRLVGTVAALPSVKRVFWFDGENGAETLLHMGLSEEALQKVTLFQIPDTRAVPRFIETVLKAFTSKTPVSICDAHGKVGCIECQKAGAGSAEIFIPSLTSQDVVVVDSGSQLGTSALALAMIEAGASPNAKPSWDEYTVSNGELITILNVMQAAATCTFILITHSLPIEEEYNKVKRDRLIPLMGTKALSVNVGKYFGSVILTEVKLKKHTAGSSSTYRADAVTGSRTGVSLETEGAVTLATIMGELNMKT